MIIRDQDFAIYGPFKVIGVSEVKERSTQTITQTPFVPASELSHFSNPIST